MRNTLDPVSKGFTGKWANKAEGRAPEVKNRAQTMANDERTNVIKDNIYAIILP